MSYEGLICAHPYLTCFTSSTPHAPTTTNTPNTAKYETLPQV